MSKLVSIDNLLTISQELGLKGHDGYVDVFEKLATSLAEVIAKETGVAILRPAEWMGEEFGGLCVGFVPAHKGQPCPQVIDDR